MDEKYENLLKSIVIKLNAIELTLLESNLRDEYIKNFTHWKKSLNSKIGEALLSSFLKDEFDDSIPPEQ